MNALTQPNTYTLDSRDCRRPLVRRKPAHQPDRSRTLAEQSIRFGSGSSRALFFGSLATMLDAGVHIDGALDALEQTADDEGVRVASRAAATAVRCGHPLSHALSPYRGCFPTFHLRLLSIGEQTGSLTQTLRELAEFEEKRQQLAHRVRQALAYPAVVMVVGLLLLLAAGRLFSGLAQTFAGLGIALPAPAALLIGLSSAAGNPWLLACTGISGWCARRRLARWWRGDQTRARLRRICDRVPGLGRALAIAAALRFVRALALQIRVGVRIDRAISAAFAVSDDPILQEKAEVTLSCIARGSSLAGSLRKTGSFPNLVWSMIQCGEASGKLELMLARCASALEEELEYRLLKATAALEPIALTAMGLFVGCVALGMVLPMAALLRV